MALAQQQELDFQDNRSAASSVVRSKHGDGRRGNLNRSLQGRQPAKEQHVRMEKEEGIASKLVKGVGRGMRKAMSTIFLPPEFRAGFVLQ